MHLPYMHVWAFKSAFYAKVLFMSLIPKLLLYFTFSTTLALRSGSQNFLARRPYFKKCSMDHFAMLTPHEQLVETIAHRSVNVFIKNLWNCVDH